MPLIDVHHHFYRSPVGSYRSTARYDPYDPQFLLSGTFRRLPDIRWIFSYGGGTVPFLAGRIQAFYDKQARAPNGFAPNGIEAELQRHYYDTANSAFPASMAALRKLVAVSQIIYGTDYPYFPLNQIKNLRERADIEYSI
jgi:6-methylsalicylate decarboxylase